MDLSRKFLSTAYQIKMNISFPRLDSLDSAKSANYRKAEKMTKKVLLAEIQRKQISLDSLHGKIAKFETVQDS